MAASEVVASAPPFDSRTLTELSDDDAGETFATTAGDCGWGYGAGPCGPGGGLYSYATSNEAIETLAPADRPPHGHDRSDVAYSCMSACFRLDRVILGTSWNYVGEGRGGYSKVSTYNYVGHGAGSFEKEVRTTHHGWRPRRCCLFVFGSTALLLIGLCMVAALRGRTLIPGTPVATGGDSVSSTSGATTDTLLEDPDCVVAASGNDPYIHWTIKQHEWCCANYKMGCKLLLDRAKRRFRKAQQKAQQQAAEKAVQAAPPSGAKDSLQQSQVPRNESLFQHNASSVGSSSSSGNSSSSVTTDNNTQIVEQETLPTGNASSSSSAQENPSASNTSSSRSVQASTTFATAYNCDEDRGNWETAWSRVKQAWCCSRHAVGCSTVAPSAA